MSEKNVIYHIGLPKTGTTFLQKAYFPNLRGNITIARRGCRLEWVRFVERITDDIAPASGELLDANSVIYSAESISNIWLRVNQYVQPLDMGDVADRVLAFHKIKFGKTYTPHILIGFRRFETWIVSYYAEYDTVTDFDELLNYVERNPSRYSRHIIEKCFRDRIGSDRIGSDRIGSDRYLYMNRRRYPETLIHSISGSMILDWMGSI